MKELQKIRTAIAELHKGELNIKDYMAFDLSMENQYKKINVSHLMYCRIYMFDRL
jgi:membrane protein insertase Oxa1/YidC/SpoIIIJ